MTRATLRDRGFTLIELLVSITIMSLAFAAILAGLGLFLKTELVQRESAARDAAIRTYAEQIMTKYQKCAPPSNIETAKPAGFTTAATVTYWEGTWATSGPTFGPLPCSDDHGLQQVEIVMTSGGRSDRLVVVVSK
jgi:prepilin-type N-terminal cleavage/methylation domain-containing protein